MAQGITLVTRVVWFDVAIPNDATWRSIKDLIELYLTNNSLTLPSKWRWSQIRTFELPSTLVDGSTARGAVKIGYDDDGTVSHTLAAADWDEPISSIETLWIQRVSGVTNISIKLLLDDTSQNGGWGWDPK